MKKREEKNSPVVRLLFVVYCVCMLYLLFVRGRAVESELPYWEQVLQNYNLKPLHTIHNYWDVLARPEHYLEKWGAMAIYKEQAKTAIINLVGNVVLFIPFGAFLPACFRKFKKFWCAVPTAFGTLVTVEIGQLLSLRGSCDVDDLILNMAGVLLGFVSWKLVAGHHRK